MNKFLTTIVTLSVLITACVPQKTQVNENTNQNVNTNTSQNDDIDTSDWKTYRNEEYGFEFRYPESWRVEETGNTLIVSNPKAKWPEKDSMLMEVSKNFNTLDTFVRDYNTSDVVNGQALASIIQNVTFSFGSTQGRKLVGSTSIGVNAFYYWVETQHEYSLVVKFVEQNEYHESILDTFVLL